VGRRLIGMMIRDSSFPARSREDVNSLRNGAWVAPMNEAAKIVDQIQRALPRVKRGSLRFWGNWLGRPYDNSHSLVGCEAQQDILRMHFHEDEVLTVWFPKRFTLDDSTFRINDAERVRWEWFYYGRPKTDANRFFRDFMKTGETVVASTNASWHTLEMKMDLSLPAVEIL
jgi:hypothetical protein